MEKRTPPRFPDGEIDKFLRDRVCSRCYGELQKKPAEGRLWEAHCPTCGDAWGYTTISRKHAEIKGQEALANYLDVRFDPAYTHILGPREAKSQDQILRELGF